jgi:cysteine-rich repeat protein
MSFENFGGDGGSQDYFAGRDIVMSQDVTMEANGAQPDGYGEAISLLADAAISIDGDIRAKSSGVFGGGGSIELTADGPIYVGPTSSMDVTGISGGGGDIDVIGESSTELRGTVDVSASGGGYGGAIYVTTRTGLDISGSLVTNGTESNGSNGSLDVEGCDVTVTGTGVLDNGGELGDNLVTAGRDITIATGGQILATLSGTNTFIHRDAANPPVINGTVTPAPTIIVSPGLSTCSQCGDGVVQSSETCDDGNTVGGDGCSADCQDEGCIAETTGYPAVPLCDDAKVCTTDACVDGACTHTVACDDGIDCTFDACNGVGSCVHTPTNSLCDDGNACTTDACSAADGCTWTFLSSACDDGLECTSNDICSFGLCAGTVNCPGGLACNGDTGICETTTTTTTSTTTTTTTTLDTTTTTSTSTSTTTTTLMGQVCGNAAVEGSETCDDGDTDWSQGLYCDATCNELACADTDDNTTVTATDALFILRVAVSLATCDACVCDTDGSGTTTAGDSLRALRRAVGVSIALLCPVCPT